jgi:Flp pilus assembly protein TadB
MLDFLFVIIGLLLLAPLLSLAKAQRRNKLAQTVPRAVEIAKIHGWVSAGRLMTQANITEKDAKDALVEASRQGLLFQAEDGRYYLKQEASFLPM